MAVFLGLVMASSASAVDTITSSTYIDNDGNGTVDRVRWTFDENVTSCTYEAGDWTLDIAGSIGIAITGLSCTGSDANLDILVTADANETGGDTNPQITYDNVGTPGSVGLASGAAGNHIATAVTDGAAPVFVSTSPADTATNVDRASDIVLTFSEAMATSFVEGVEFSISPDPGGFSAVFSSNDTVVTLTAPNFACGVAYTVTTTEANIDAAAGSPTAAVTTGPVDGDFSFTVESTGCSTNSVGNSADDTSEEEVVISYDVDLESIEDAEAGDFYSLMWTSSDNFNLVDLWYSTDGGDTYMVIADNESNDGLYKWSIPDDVGDDFMVKIEATYLTNVLASDTESASGEVAEEASEDEEEEVVEDEVEEDEEQDEEMDEEEDEEEDDGPAWEVDGVEPGDVIRGETLSTLYYITDNYERRAFISEAVYFTWYDDFDHVEMISDDDLAAFTLGGLMLPKAGTVLVKIASDPSVYALGEGEDAYTPVLNYIESEDDAIALWGDDWADYVIDIESTFIARFDSGDHVDADHYEVDMDEMIKREELHS